MPCHLPQRFTLTRDCEWKAVRSTARSDGFVCVSFLLAKKFLLDAQSGNAISYHSWSRGRVMMTDECDGATRRRLSREHGPAFTLPLRSCWLPGSDTTFVAVVLGRYHPHGLKL